MNGVRAAPWRHPYWWMAAISAAAWVGLIARWSRPNHGHAHTTTFAIGDWTLMVAAMMLPLVFRHVQFTATRSLWRRRQRAMLGFVCGYASIWLLAGAVASAVLLALGRPDLPNLPWLPAAAFGLAAMWQLVPLRRRAMASCHRTMPLAPHGWRADRDCLRYGCSIGARCFVTCAALMLGCVVAGHSLLAMLSATVVAGVERYDVRADERSTSMMLALVAVVYAIYR